MNNWSEMPSCLYEFVSEFIPVTLSLKRSPFFALFVCSRLQALKNPEDDRLRRGPVRSPNNGRISPGEMAAAYRAIAIWLTLLHVLHSAKCSVPDDLSNCFNEYVCDTRVRLVR